MSSNNHKLPYIQNRDISFLRFNKRVIELAANDNIPFFERLKYLTIASTNLDEFFMIRMGSLFDILHIKKDAVDSKTGLNLDEQIKIIYAYVENLNIFHLEAYLGIVEHFKNYQIEITSVKQLTSDEKKEVKEYFKNMIKPILSPQVIDHNHPFPHIESKKEHIGLYMSANSRDVFGLLPVPSTQPLYILHDKSGIKKVLFVQDIILYFIEDVFSMFKIQEKVLFSVTRNADVQLEESFEDALDTRVKIKEMLKKRRRLSVVRLEVNSTLSKEFSSFLTQKFNIDTYQKFQITFPMSYTMFPYMKELIQNKDYLLSFKEFHANRRFKFVKIIPTILNRDIFLTYPYDSFYPFLNLILEASIDPTVISIKITIYRLARRAKLIDYLIQAAENGKEVTVVIELKARFDEQNNIDFSEVLESSGCKVIYGLDTIKIHSKLCVITKQEKNQIRYITQIATGNFNETTVKLYTDFALITAHPGIAKDALAVFDTILLNQHENTYEHLLVSPNYLKHALIHHISNESSKGEDGYIFIKINSLTDIDVIRALVEASQKGVRIDMFIRSITCLLPNVKGYTDNINIYSIIGRFLEHSRLFVFGKQNPHIYIGSADMMTRNTERRIEVATPIYQENIRAYILRYIDTLKKDNIDAKQLDFEGEHKPIYKQSNDLNSQSYMIEHYLDMAPRYKEKTWIEKILKK